MRQLLVVAFLGVLVNSGVAFAEPVLTHEIHGSTIFIYATNSDNAKYNCNVSWTLLYRDFGENGSRNFQQPAVVESNYRSIVITSSTAYESSSLRVRNFDYNCFRVSQSPPSQSQQLPGGTYHESCHGCAMNGYVLSCRCDGNDTSLNLANCSPQGRNLVCNNNGTLNCTGGC